VDDTATQAIPQPPRPPSPAAPIVSAAERAEPPKSGLEVVREARADEPLIVLAYATLRRELDSLRSHAPQPGGLPEPEKVHRLRIAARRLRTALRLFRPVLPRKRSAALREELRWFARALSEVRDLDVHTEDFRRYLQTLPPEQLQGVGDYELHVRRARAETRGELAELFGKKRYRALLASFDEFLRGAPSPAALRRSRSLRVSDGFEKYLSKSAKRVAKFGNKLGPKSRGKKLHKLRIRAKRLRYELEFFAPIYPSLDAVAKASKALQDVLGTHQDARSASARIKRYVRRLARDDAAGAPAGMQRLLDLERHRAQEARRAFAAEWRRFTSTLTIAKLAA
jgi:CHAD domain-containing protein